MFARAHEEEAFHVFASVVWPEGEAAESASDDEGEFGHGANKLEVPLAVVECRYKVDRGPVKMTQREETRRSGTALGRVHDAAKRLRATRTRAVGAAVAVAALGVAGSVGALPMVGSSAPSVGLVDAWDRPNDLQRYVGKPILVIYEDKDSATVNQALKNELSVLAKGDRYKESVALFAVADVGAFDFWPVRGFVKDAIRKESRRQGTDIYCDWDGHVRAALGLVEATSNVVLFARDGKVAFSQAGALSVDGREALLGALRREVEGGRPGG